jgi:hypothetical protein
VNSPARCSSNWTIDPALVLVYARTVGTASWGAVVTGQGDGIRLYDLDHGLVTDAIPHPSGAWLTRAWIVTDRASEATRRVFHAREALARHVDLLLGLSPLEEKTVADFTFAASVVIADCPDTPDVALLVREDLPVRDPERRGAAWTRQGVNPAANVLHRLFEATRAAASA